MNRNDIQEALRRMGVLMWAREYCVSQGSTLLEVLSSDRHASVARARHRLWTVMRHTLGLSYPELARIFGVDHTTIMSGVKKCEAQMQAAAPSPEEFERTVASVQARRTRDVA